jgi:hypothetical protein
MRRPVPEVDSMELLEELDKYVKSTGIKQAFYFGPYEVISRSQAAYGGGLAANSEILATVLRVAPAGEVKANVLKGHMMKLATRYNGLTQGSPLGMDLWAGKKADIILTMLAHLRRVRQDTPRAKQLQHKATDADVLKVEKLCNLLDMPHASAFEMPSPRDSAWSLPGSCKAPSSPGR